MEPNWLSGCWNWREYWIKACMSPSGKVPLRHHDAADHGDAHVDEVSNEHRGGHDDAGDELGTKTRLVELLVLGGELRPRLALTPEHLDQRVTRVALLDLRVQLARVLPLRHELACERLATCATMTMVSGIERMAMSASHGEIQTIMMRMPMTVSTEMKSWLRVCCSVCDTLSMSLVTRLSSSPRWWLVEVAQREAVDLLLHPAEAAHSALCHAVEDPALRDREQR